MMQFKRSLLSVALASALQTVAVAAYAADEADAAAAETKQGEQAKKQEDEAVRLEVTGIRAGIEKSIETKRESTEIVEAITAEDIGKLPDVSIAESIARLPGLTAQRVAGRASTIQIRGFAEDFGTVLLNGREQVSVGHNRGVEFDQYPSELMSQVVVYKTPNARLVGQGLSGTVDLRTVQPLDYSERVMAANLRFEENSNGKVNPDTDDKGNRFSFSYIDQFLNNKVGLAIGYAHLDTPSQARRWDSWGYATQNLDGQDVFVLGGTKAQASSSENIRDGLMAVLEFKPSDAWHSTLDTYYSEFENTETLRFHEAGTVWIEPFGWANTPTDYVIVGPSVMSGTFSGINPVVRNDRNTSDDELFAIGWKNEFRFGEAWSALLDVSHSEADRKASILETYAGLGYNFSVTDTVDFVIDRDGFTQATFGNDYSNPNTLYLTDPMHWGQDGYIKYPEISDELESFRVSAERVFSQGMFKSLEFGVNYTDREKSRSVTEYKLELAADQVALPAGSIVGVVDLGFAGAPDILALDVDDLLSSYNFVPNVHYDIYNKTWSVNEKVTTAFAQLNIDTNIGSIDVRGNVGVQYVRTDQSSKGTDPARAAPVTGGTEYSDVLPSLNLSLGFADDHVVRIGLAKQIARARMDHMRASQDVSIATTGTYAGRWVGSGGNPDLKPWEANAADLTYEYYFGEQGYVSVGAFYKDLKTYIYNGTVEYDFSGIDTSSYDPDLIPDSSIGYLTGPMNGEGGTMDGWEVSASLPFNLLSDVLDGFGIQANYSDTDSSIKPNGPDGADEPLPGLSETVSNITLYYEKQGFSARVSQRHRSDFLGEVQGFGGDRNKVYIKGEDVVDMQIGYSFAEGGSLEGLSLLLQVNNLTDEPYQQYFATQDDLPQFYAEYGRTTLLGASYKF
jgi:iron complex outermembrane recepter protein